MITATCSVTASFVSVGAVVPCLTQGCNLYTVYKNVTFRLLLEFDWLRPGGGVTPP
jgi:hypothetical protein